MKRPIFVLALGILAGALAFGAAFWSQTRQSRPDGSAPSSELAWLRHEFRLSDIQFARVAALHEAYKPTCAALCRRIGDQNRRLRDAVARTNAVSEELRGLVAETGRARDACRQAMLEHLYAVAREMPPAEGERYLQIMLGATCVLQDARPLEAVQAAPRPSAREHHD